MCRARIRNGGHTNRSPRVFELATFHSRIFEASPRGYSAKRKSIVFYHSIIVGGTSGDFLSFFGKNVFFSSLIVYFGSLFFFFSICGGLRMKRLEKRGSRVIRLLAVGWGKEIIMEHRDDTSGTNVNRVRDCFRVRSARCTRENYGLSR